MNPESFASPALRSAVGCGTAAQTRSRRAERSDPSGGRCTAPLALSAGVYAPLQPLRGYSLTAPVRSAGAGADPASASAPASVNQHVVVRPFQLYVTRLADSLRFTCYGELAPVRRDGAGPPTEGLVRQLVEVCEFVFPNVRELCDWDAAVPWVGARPLTPDCMPIVGATRRRGLYLNAGHSFNGWREAAHSAQLVAARISGSAPQAGARYLSVFSITRFQPFPNPAVHRLAPTAGNW